MPDYFEFVPDMMGKPIDALKFAIDCTLN